MTIIMSGLTRSGSTKGRVFPAPVAAITSQSMPSRRLSATSSCHLRGTIFPSDFSLHASDMRFRISVGLWLGVALRACCSIATTVDIKDQCHWLLDGSRGVENGTGTANLCTALRNHFCNHFEVSEHFRLSQIWTVVLVARVEDAFDHVTELLSSAM